VLLKYLFSCVGQERSGLKIVVIQDTNAPSGQDKPLRISGGDRASIQVSSLHLFVIK